MPAARSAFRQAHRRHAVLLGTATVASLVVITHMTYLTGGTAWVVPHLYYLPIVAGAFLGGWWGGVLIALTAGLLCGPLMPLNVEQGVAQSTFNWGSRLVFFMLVGGMAGVMFQQLRARIGQLDELARQSLASFVKTVDAKSPYTAEHSRNVAHFAHIIAQQMNLSDADCARLYWAGLLHDIGKISVPDPVLNKQGSLSEQEWALMRQHPIDSVRILENLSLFQDCLPAIRHHHERVDGRGYPDGVSGDALSRDARILAVADALEAMVADRPYRQGMPIPKALERLHQGAGTQFDPEPVQAAWSAYVQGILAPAPRNASTRVEARWPKSTAQTSAA